MCDLDEAVKATIDWINQDGDAITMDNTLSIATSDHSNSYMRLVDGKEMGKGELLPFARMLARSDL